MPENDDTKIWVAYAKSIKPLKRIPKSVFEAHPQPPAPVSAPQGKETEKTVPARVNFQAPLERNLERRLRQGSFVPEARLDLHGMRETEAHRALMDFVDKQATAGRRYLLVITGKGRGGQGILRVRLKDWLTASDHATRILALRPAAIRHGGDGAFYVLLKRGKIRYA